MSVKLLQEKIQLNLWKQFNEINKDKLVRKNF